MEKNVQLKKEEGECDCFGDRRKVESKDDRNRGRT